MSTTAPDSNSIRAAIWTRGIDYAVHPIRYYEFGHWREAWVEWLARPQRHWGVDADDLVNGMVSLGLQGDLDRRITADAVTYLSQTQRTAVAVNVVASSLADREFCNTLLVQLARHGVSPDRLALEITEHQPVTELAATAECADRLRAVGVRIGIDDLGRGWHAATTALELGFLDYAKLDRCVFADARVDPLSRDRLRAVLHSARQRKLDVVAEGIQSEGELIHAEKLGIRYFQGYYWGGPRAVNIIAERSLRRASGI